MHVGEPARVHLTVLNVPGQFGEAVEVIASITNRRDAAYEQRPDGEEGEGAEVGIMTNEK